LDVGARLFGFARRLLQVPNVSWFGLGTYTERYSYLRDRFADREISQEITNAGCLSGRLPCRPLQGIRHVGVPQASALSLWIAPHRFDPLSAIFRLGLRRDGFGEIK
jgi:hypothetical protein